MLSQPWAFVTETNNSVGINNKNSFFIPSHVSQVISGFATLGALTFIGFQSIQTRKQTRIMQGPGWIGATEESWITESEHDIIVSLNYGNVISKVLVIKFLVKEPDE